MQEHPLHTEQTQEINTITQSRKRSRIWFFVLLTFFVGIAGVIGTGFGLYFYYEDDLPSVETLATNKYNDTLNVYSADGQIIAKFGDKRRIPKKFQEFPRQVVNAFIAAEDANFFDHIGVDFKAFLRVGFQYIKTGKINQGASTITMQVARNFFLTHEKTLLRKIREIILAIRIENHYSKKKIMELYLNKIFLGKRSYGVAAAAAVYYGKELKDLNLPEIAMIAGLPKAPSRFNPIINPKRATIRRNYVLRRMKELKFITPKLYKTHIKSPLSAKIHSKTTDLNAPYVAEMVRLEMIKLLGEDNIYAGYKVWTTINSKLQNSANKAIERGLINHSKRHGFIGKIGSIDSDYLTDTDKTIDELSHFREYIHLKPAVVLASNQKELVVLTELGDKVNISKKSMRWLGRKIKLDKTFKRGDVIYVSKHKNKDKQDYYKLSQLPTAQAALVAMDPNDGKILSLVGGFDFKNNKFNRATQAIRQPGSSFKPFLYSAALNKGYTAATIINDAPVMFDFKTMKKTWKPKNFSGKFNGPTRLREALVKSMNVISIRILKDIGVGYLMEYATRFGFDKKTLEPNLALSLGNANIKPIELAAGFSTFANGGYRVKPYFISKIATNNGEVLYKARPTMVCTNCQMDEKNKEQYSKEDKEVNDNLLVKFDKNKKNQYFIPATKTIRDSNAFIMTTILKEVITRGTATRASTLGRRDLAGKTGTTNDSIDAWFTGFNSDIVASVWVGRDDNKTLGYGETGGKAALPIWMEFIKTAIVGTKIKRLKKPASVVSITIDKKTGRAAYPDPGYTMREYFRRGSAPKPASGKSHKRYQPKIEAKVEDIW
jgi:penicillin-binding protein 1A